MRALIKSQINGDCFFVFFSFIFIVFNEVFLDWLNKQMDLDNLAWNAIWKSILFKLFSLFFLYLSKHPPKKSNFANCMQVKQE